MTSGMACLAMGISQATKDCDILCAPTAARQLLDRLLSTPFLEAASHCSPPGINFLERPAVWAEQGVVCFKR